MLFEDIFKMASGITGTKLPAGVIAAALGFEQGNSGEPFNEASTEQVFKDHFIPVDAESKSAFNLGQMVGRAVRLYNSIAGGDAPGAAPYGSPHFYDEPPPGSPGNRQGPFGGFGGRF